MGGPVALSVRTPKSYILQVPFYSYDCHPRIGST